MIKLTCIDGTTVHQAVHYITHLVRKRDCTYVWLADQGANWGQKVWEVKESIEEISKLIEEE